MKPRMPRKPRIEPIDPNVEIDYKNIPLLQKFLSDRGRIMSRRLSGITARQQRRLSEAVKRARFLGLLSSGRADA